MSSQDWELRQDDIHLENRLWPRVFAAVPELVMAISIVAIWLWPMAFGRVGVISTAIAVAYELPVLLICGGLRLLGMRRWFDPRLPAMGIGPLVVAAWWSKVIFVDWWYVAPERWLAWAIIGVLIGKAMIFWNSRRNAPAFDATVAYVQALAFAICILFAMNAPDRGLTPEVIAALDLPNSPSFPNFGEAGVQWGQAAAGAASYFAISAILRFLFLVRPAPAPR